MTHSIVFCSRTGNTRLLAETIHAAVPEADCLFFGEPDPKALQAERIYLGFWTDKGTCDEQAAAFLAQLTTQEVFLFGTAGFGGDAHYFDQILGRVKALLPGGTTLVGSYMCQGRMPQGVRDRYEAMEEGPRRDAMLQNFDQALTHPDAADLDRLTQAVRTMY